MPRNPRDPKGYYQVLNLSPGASSAEVKLAYTFLKNAWRTNRKLPRARIKEAYDCLTDPASRREYDSPSRRGGGPGPEQLRLTGAVILLAALLGFGGFVFPGFLIPGPDAFEAGDRLVSAVGETSLGEILRSEAVHVFPGGRTGEAYLVRLSVGGERWFPASDLERNYRRR